MGGTIEELNATVPKLPQVFESWTQSHMPPVFIYYRREKKGASCLCGKCNIGYHTDEVPVRHGTAECPWCGARGMYEWKKVTTQRIKDEFFSILQVTSDEKLVLRAFRRRQVVQQGYECCEKTTELQRCFFDMSGVEVIEKYYSYCERGWKWGRGRSHGIDGVEIMFPGYDDEIRKTPLKYCDADMLCHMAYGRVTGWRLQSVLTAYVANPALEMYAKSGMKKLVKALICNKGKSRHIHRKGKSIQKQLRLKDKNLIKKLVAAKGDMDLLRVLQYEQKTGIRWNEEQEKFAARYMDDLPFFLKHMSLQQLMNRIEKYVKAEDYDGELNTVIHYRDYLDMREELGYDMTNEVYVHPKNLKQKHDELVKESSLRKDELRIVNADKEYSNIAEKYESIAKKYGYEEGGYFIRPAKSAGEIILEGQFLHHCVGRNDHYINKHNKGTSYIVFLRRKSEPDTPYYTIEISGDKIIQWYSMNDRKPDREIIEPLLDRWVEWIKKQGKTKKTV